MPRLIALFGLIIIYLMIATSYAYFTPPWQTPDEPAHYNFVRYIVQNYRLPELVRGCYDQTYLNQIISQKFLPHLSIADICYEHYQPPLYYVLAAPIFAMTDGSLFALRLFSVCLGAITLVIVYKTIALFCNNSLFVLNTTAFVAFIPMHLSILASVNNDGLAELLYVSFTYALLSWLFFQAPHQHLIPIWVGGLLGLILLTKITIYVSLPLSAFVLILGDRCLKALWQNGLRLYLPALLIASPLYIRNGLIYGGFDILGLARHDAVVVGQLRTAAYIAEVGWLTYFNNLFQSTFHSFWGQFGWMAVPMDYRVYSVLGLLSVLALAGLIHRLCFRPAWVKRTPQSKSIQQALWVMALSLLLVSGIFMGLNRSFVQFQGRYFFTALMPLGLFFTLGLTEALKKDLALKMTAIIILAAITTMLNARRADIFNKWTLLICGGSVLSIFARRWLPLNDSHWLVAFIYVALIGLSAVSVWWFILPNL